MTASGYLFGIFQHFVIVLSVLLRMTASGYLFGIFQHFVFVLSVLLRMTASGFPFVIFYQRDNHKPSFEAGQTRQ
jgi:hypothetical protein